MTVTVQVPLYPLVRAPVPVEAPTPSMTSVCPVANACGVRVVMVTVLPDSLALAMLTPLPVSVKLRI
jgi:hypothetical protein